MRYIINQQLDWLTYIELVTTALVVLGVFWLLFAKPHILHPVKRIGLSLIGSGLLMNIATIDGSPTPFGQWTTVLARLGVLILLVGYGVDHHLLSQLQRLNEWKPRDDSTKNRIKLLSLRQAAWSKNVKDRKIIQDDKDEQCYNQAKKQQHKLSSDNPELRTVSVKGVSRPRKRG